MKRYCIPLLACLLAAIGTEAFASEFSNGPYVGGSFGVADNLDVCDDLGNPTSPSRCEDSDLGWQLFAGWQLVKWLAVEGGYTDLGESSYTDVNGTTTTLDSHGFLLNLVWAVPLLEKAGLYFKTGAYMWENDMRSSTVLNVSTTDSEDDIDFVYSVALRYPLSDRLGVNVEWQRFEDIGNSKTDKFDLNLWSAGLLLRF